DVSAYRRFMLMCSGEKDAVAEGDDGRLAEITGVVAPHAAMEALQSFGDGAIGALVVRKTQRKARKLDAGRRNEDLDQAHTTLCALDHQIVAKIVLSDDELAARESNEDVLTGDSVGQVVAKTTSHRRVVGGEADGDAVRAASVLAGGVSAVVDI